ncbi:hypothetical protein [Alkalihalobacterium alkalinitrilicum]|uniref:hypothetical protein n=1 Tax=Alkalihalobacterium alkalinitrilicum TaxID=427920 RepID=UPI001C55B842|nr:hypothetical protein [Alkalihalobacterium alkalinitrilicum]
MWLNVFLSLISIITLIFSIVLLTLRQAALPLSLCLMGLTIYFSTVKNIDIEVLLNGISEMRVMVFVLVVVPIVRWVLNSKKYIQSVMVCSNKYLRSSISFYAGMMAVTQVVSFFLLVAAVPVTYQFVSRYQIEKNKALWEYLKNTAIIRGFALTSIWSISIPSFVYAIEALGASVKITIFHGFILSIVGIMIGTILFAITNWKNTSALTVEIRKTVNYSFNSNEEKVLKRLLLEFFLLLVSLIFSILIFNFYFSWGLLKVIPIVVIIWTVTYFIIQKKLKFLLTEVTKYFKTDIPLKAKEVSIFLSAGLLISSINESRAGQILIEEIYHLIINYNFINFLVILPFLIVLFAFFGLPASASMVLVGGILQGVLLPYSPEAIVLSLTLGNVIGVLISPFMIPGVLLSSVNMSVPYRYTFASNKLYALCFIIVAIIYILVFMAP